MRAGVARIERIEAAVEPLFSPELPPSQSAEVIFQFPGARRRGMVRCMNALKDTIIEKLDGLPEPTLRQVMDYLTFLTWRGTGEEPSLLSVAGGLSGAPMSAEEIERELYGQRETR